MLTKALTVSFALSLAAAGLTGSIGCTTTAPPSENARENLNDRAGAVLSEMKRADPDLQRTLDKSYGYVVFPDAGKVGVALAGASFGRGEVYEQGNFIGYAKLEQGTVGPQIGGQTFDELIIFENLDSLRRFTRGEWAPAANASAVILKSGAAATAPYKDGVLTVINAKGGAMAEASVGGQKFSFQAAAKKEMQ